MELIAPLVTREAETDGAGALVAVAIDRLGRSRTFKGLLLGLGLRGGAVALSSGWESAAVTAVGDRPDDLATAVERLRELRGGAVVVARGEVLGEWRAELLGGQSLGPVAEIVEQVAAVQGALRSLGCEQPNPLQTVETLTTAAIPHLRLTPDGYARLRDGARLGLEL
jgi:adenine deaminase